EVREDALVHQALAAEDALGATERVSDDRQSGRLDEHVTDLHAANLESRYDRRAGHAMQQHVDQLRRGVIDLVGDPRGDRGMTRAGVEHQAKRSLAVDLDGRPDAPYPIPQRGRDVHWLGSGD